jgi:endonuclease/exonuclease/phosphatase family metal-dependent hydrolase
MRDVLRAMTYNVHGCVGTDGVLDPNRIARVIAMHSPDIVALQELDVGRRRSGAIDQPRYLAEALAYGYHFTAARNCEGGTYGNAVLTRHPFEVRSEGLLPVRTGEVRSVQWLRIETPIETIDVLNTHLGLDRRERDLQVATILSAEWLAHVERSDAVVVCGDFNAGPRSRVYRRLTEDLTDAQSARKKPTGTWPSRFPLVRLDHILSSGRAKATRCIVPRDALTRVASDHLPVVVDLELTPRPRESKDEALLEIA